MKLIDPKSVLALTATAGPRVIEDICQTLEIPNTNKEESVDGVLTLSTNRDNIDVQCLFLSSQEERLKKVRINLLAGRFQTHKLHTVD